MSHTEPIRHCFAHTPWNPGQTSNADNSAQSFNLGMPIFNSRHALTDRDPANFNADADVAWAAFDSPVVTGQAGDAYAQVAIRLTNDGGENFVIVAMPAVLGPAVSNLAANPGFLGTSGETQGTVSGSAPADWRAFAIGAGTLNVSSVALAAGALSPGSLPTQAVRLGAIGGDGFSEGFDQESMRATLSSDYLHWGEF